MKGTNKSRLGTPVLAAILVASTGMVGCASTSALQSLQAEVDAVSADAQAAKAEAASAKADAAAAKSLARDAMATADEAKSTSEATEAKIDRMFKKAMYK